MGYTELDTAFKEAIGEFTIAFSQMEFALSQLSALTVVKQSEYDLLANIRLPLHKKRKQITEPDNRYMFTLDPGARLTSATL